MSVTMDGLRVLWLVGAIFSAIMTGIGWSVLNGSDVCTTSMHTYIEAVTITATVSLALYPSCICEDAMEAIAAVYNAGVIAILAIIDRLLNFTWFI